MPLVRTPTRLSRRSASDLRTITHAARRIQELTGILDRQLTPGMQADPQMRDLRQATGQITRAANDAVQAYRRVTGALRDEAARPDGDAVEIAHARRELAAARAGLLAELQTASLRYPWAAPLLDGD